MHLVSGTIAIGPDRSVQNVVFICTREGSMGPRKGCRLEGYFFLFRMGVEGSAEKKDEKLSFLQYLECAQPLNLIGETMGLVCLNRKTDVEDEYACQSGKPTFQLEEG